MPPADAAPGPRPDAAAAAAASSRNAVRGGILAALSSPPPPPQPAPPPAAAVPVQTPPPPPAPVLTPLPPPPLRGAEALLRAAGRRGLRAARPLAAPFLHRLQTRFRTAVDESGLPARTAGVEQALAGLSGRIDAETADLKRLVVDGARRLDALAGENARGFDALQRGLGAFQRGFDALREGIARAEEAAAANARRLDAANAAAAAAAADSALRQEAMQRRLDETQQRLEAVQQRLEAVQQGLEAVQRGVTAVPDLVGARVPPRAPIPLGGDFLVYTPDGTLLVPAEDHRFLAVIADGGVLEAGTRRVLAALLRPGGVFLDVGANVGTMTLLAARAVGPAGRVFAVEPTPRIAALLRRSMAVNDVADRVAVEACAAGEGEGEALLHLEEVMSHNTLFPLAGEAEGRGTLRVQVRPADDLVPAGTPVDVAKIDAEGAELQVWRGMKRILAESPDLSVVLEFGPSHLARVGVTPEAWLREVEAPGFAPFMIDDMTGVCRPASADALAAAFSTNVVLLRPGAAARHPDLVFA